MKYVFLIIFAVLTTISLGYGLLDGAHSQNKPVLYWVTDNNPARAKQVRLFEEWVRKNYHRNVELHIDTANADPSKKLIQGVSGVGDDIMDMSPADVQLFNAVGILQNLTEPARQLGFDTVHTYKSVVPLLMADGHQVAFPCNVYVTMFWINKATLEKYGLPTPPRRWNLEEFERMGRQFVAAANPPGRPRTHFFALTVSWQTISRSLGADMLNETLTASNLTDPQVAQSLELVRKWIYVDHIIPGEADVAAFSVNPGYGGAELQLFNSGNIAMFPMGRYALIQLREFGNLQLAVSEPPNGGFPNTIIGTRCAGIYAGSSNQYLADLFLAFLASKEYNLQIVRDADALPPNPKYTLTPEFLRPPNHPNEWGCHEAFSEAAQSIAISPAISPYILPSVEMRYEAQAYNAAVTSGRLSPSQALAQAALAVNDEIQRSLSENPALRPRYEQAAALQKKIDRYRAQAAKFRPRGSAIPSIRCITGKKDGLSKQWPRQAQSDGF